MTQRIDVLCPHCGRDFELSLDDAEQIAAQEQLVRRLERLTRQAVNELGCARQRQREQRERAKPSPLIDQAAADAVRKLTQKPNADAEAIPTLDTK
jgi:phage terminase large subunit GpA-like protein